MNKLFICFCLCVAFSCSYAQEPLNLFQTRQTLINYHDSGEYERDINKVVSQAKYYLMTHIKKQSQPKKLAIVFDIDETALSSYPNMRKLNFGGTLQEIKRLEMLGQNLTIKPTLKLYQFARNNGIAVFFVSGREENERASTIRNLIKAGYKNWKGMYLKPVGAKFASISDFKAAQRAKITKLGYNVILNLGDQYSDLKGKFAGKGYKLPNPYYFIP